MKPEVKPHRVSIKASVGAWLVCALHSRAQPPTSMVVPSYQENLIAPGYFSSRIIYFYFYSRCLPLVAAVATSLLDRTSADLSVHAWTACGGCLDTTLVTILSRDWAVKVSSDNLLVKYLLYVERLSLTPYWHFDVSRHNPTTEFYAKRQPLAVEVDAFVGNGEGHGDGGDHGRSNLHHHGRDGVRNREVGGALEVTR